MLLNSEIQLGEIYVYDTEVNFLHEDELPQLYHMVQDAKPVFENIETGELVGYSTRCFTTIERIKKQYENIEKITNEYRKEFVKKAYQVILDYESSIKGGEVND